MSGLRILVCGGRDFTDAQHVDEVLTRVKQTRGIAILIHGQARGADTLAKKWAEKNGVPLMEFPANWEGDGKRAAGPIRNKRMIVEGRPDAVIAFPGGSGTANMIEQATGAGLKVWNLGA